MIIQICFSCISCDRSLVLSTQTASFPICSLCFESLTTCPQLCQLCGSPQCLTSCIRPWVSRPSISSYSSRYLLLEPGYFVLKKWKARGGLLFNRIILRSTPHLNLHWNKINAHAIVPLPQNPLRAWRMGGSRAEQIAQWISKKTRLPVLKGLTLPSHPLNQKRQAEQRLLERLQGQIRFKASPIEFRPYKKIILVDDFMTTGRTLEKAAIVLQLSGVEQIHVFCLGVRSLRMDS